MRVNNVGRESCQATDRFKTLSFQLLLQIEKEVAMEKVNDGDAKSVAELFDCGYSGAVVASADDVIYSRLSNTTDDRKFIDR